MIEFQFQLIKLASVLFALAYKKMLPYLIYFHDNIYTAILETQ